MRKIAFLDRDGTIIKDYEDAVWKEVKEPELFPDSIAALKDFRNKGYELIIVTNQYLIGEEFITQEDYDRFNAKFIRILNFSGIDVLDVFYCPHSRLSGCNCCKPKPGLIDKALKKYPSISLEDSFLAGDSITDMYLAEYFGIKAFGIGLNEDSISFTKVKTLMDVCKFI